MSPAQPSPHVALPDLTLPKGGGAIQGLNETLQTVGMTGMASFSFPLPLSAGRSLTPALALGYGSGNGPFGLGWSLAVPRLSRRTLQGVPAYQDDDEFVGPDGEALVPEVDDQGQTIVRTVTQYNDLPLNEEFQVKRFFPRIKSRFERWTLANASYPSSWLIQSADSSLHLFGKTAQARIADPAAPDTRTVHWLLEESLSPTGEHIYYEYQAENEAGLNAAQRYLKRVRYGNLARAKPLHLWEGSEALSKRWHFDLVLDYGERAATVEATLTDEAKGHWALRQDPFSDYRAGFEVRTHRLCC